jgi:transcriptional regulator with XRE-family HTH domain
MDLRLKMAMLHAGKRQIDLARHTGLGESTLSRIVNEYRPPRGEEMVRIADALGRKIEELWPDHASQATRAG